MEQHLRYTINFSIRKKINEINENANIQYLQDPMFNELFNSNRLLSVQITAIKRSNYDVVHISYNYIVVRFFRFINHLVFTWPV